MSLTLKEKNVLLGVCGSIAAYRAGEIIRLLKKRGARVFPLMTKAATYFVHPRTFACLAGEEVSWHLFGKRESGLPHLDLSSRGDLFLIAPASANFIGKIAAGVADDLLTTAVMAVQAPVIIAPAMNSRMYLNPIVQENVVKLKELGYRFVGPEKGDLACGGKGIGRMAEPLKIVESIERIFSLPKDFSDKTFLVTAGPTREPMDKVRFISNYSSGKMGYALAEEGRERGARIILISGPTSLASPPGMRVVKVETAAQMGSRVLEEFRGSDGVIMAAAVADFRPGYQTQGKIKKGAKEKLILELKKTKDILKELGKKKEKRILVGFCAETESLEKEAIRKLRDKNLDLVVANDLSQPGAGFEVDTNIALLIDRKGEQVSLPRMNKRELARIIWDKIKELMR